MLYYGLCWEKQIPTFSAIVNAKTHDIVGVLPAAKKVLKIENIFFAENVRGVFLMHFDRCEERFEAKTGFFWLYYTAPSVCLFVCMFACL